jgi:hypothetical protein
MYVAWQIKKFSFHREELFKLGYLETRSFVVTNRTPDDVADSLTTVPPQHPPVTWEFGGAFSSDTNKVKVTAPRNEMARWEKLIREADVPVK